MKDAIRMNWTIRRLDEVAKIGAGNPAPQDKALFEGGQHPFIRTSDVGQVRFGTIVDAADHLNDAGISGLRLVPAGTILLPKSGASTFLNHRVITLRDAYVSSHLATVTAKTGVAEPRYLLYALSRVAAQELLPENSYPSLNLSLNKSISLPIPPLEEQRRIVAVLDEAFEGLARARANAEANLQNARELFEKFASDLFDEITQTPSKSTLLVKDLAIHQKGSIRTGPFGSQLRHSEFVDQGVAVLGIDNAVKNEFRWGKRRFITEKKYEGLRRYTVRPGDVIITIMGTCGRCAVIPDDIPVAINTKHLCCITLDQSKCLPGYLHAYFLHSPKARSYLESEASGSVMDGLNMGIIKELPVDLPCLDRQMEVIELLETLESNTIQLSQAAAAQRDDLDDLRQSLLQQAFKGALI